jgi:hypothetical protein
MAATVLADVIDPTPMGGWVLEKTMLLSGIDQSPAVVDDPDLNSWLESEGSMTWTGPRWDSLNRTAVELTINEMAPVVFGGTAPTPQGIDTHIETAVRVERAQVHSSTKLAKYYNSRQADPLDAIITDLAQYWLYRRQAYFLATWAGVFADNDAAVDSGGTHVAGDLTLNRSAAGVYSAGVTNMTASNFIDAVQLMGDDSDSLGYIVTHSVVRAGLEKADLLETIKDSQGGKVLTYRGKQLLINDSMAKGAGNVYHTYIFGAGSTGRGTGQPDVPFEHSRYADGGNGAGQDAVWTRVRWCFHPYGHRFIGAPTANTGGPTNAATANNLAHLGSWVRTAPERKQIKAVRLITTEA